MVNIKGVLNLVKLRIIAERGTDLIDKRFVESRPVSALYQILHVLMVTVDGTSLLVLFQFGLEINPFVAGLEIIKERA